MCKQPAVMNATGVCVCPDGSRESAGTCQQCALNDFGLGGTCRACEAGTYSSALGATVCVACDYGKFRLVGMPGSCSSCPTAGWYAPSGSSSVCVPCNETCSFGGWVVDRPCPGDPTKAVCKPCPAPLPGNATWAAGGGCSYDCHARFFRTTEGCSACTPRICPTGRRLTRCSPISDSHCDQECTNASKPEIHSQWTSGPDCPWSCNNGYELRVWDYVMFQFRECVPAEA